MYAMRSAASCAALAQAPGCMQPAVPLGITKYATLAPRYVCSPSFTMNSMQHAEVQQHSWRQRCGERRLSGSATLCCGGRMQARSLGTDGNNHTGLVTGTTPKPEEPGSEPGLPTRCAALARQAAALLNLHRYAIAIRSLQRRRQACPRRPAVALSRQAVGSPPARPAGAVIAQISDAKAARAVGWLCVAPCLTLPPAADS